MKHKKIYLIMVISTILLGLLVSPVAASYFSDVSIGLWSRDGINFATDKGYITGTSGSTFEPSASLKRATVVEMFYKYAGSPTLETNTHPFTDVGSTASYRNAVIWAYSENIMNGTSNTSFEPNSTIQRKDFAVVLYRFANYCNEDTYIDTTAELNKFVDVANLPDYCKNGVAWANANKLMTGTTASAWSPNTNVDRQSGAVILMRYGIYIEGINFERDIYGFTNNEGIFGSKYTINNDYRDILKYRLSLAGKLNTMLKIDTDGEESIVMTWGDFVDYFATSDYIGSCYGMVLTTILNKVGKLNFSGNYGVSSQGLTQFHNVNSYTHNNLISAINYYQLCGHIPASLGFVSTVDKDNNTAGWNSWMADLPEKIDTYGLVIFSFYYPKGNGKTSGHSVLAYDYEYLDNTNNSYKLHIYDPNKTEPSLINIEFSSDSTSTIAKVKYSDYDINSVSIQYDFQNMYNYITLYDLDCEYNDFGLSSSTYTTLESTTLNTESDDNRAYVVLSLYNGNGVENSLGEKLYYLNGNIYGDMNIYSKNMIATGTENVAKMVLEVDDSTEFMYFNIFE